MDLSSVLSVVLKFLVVCLVLFVYSSLVHFLVTLYLLFILCFCFLYSFCVESFWYVFL